MAAFTQMGTSPDIHKEMVLMAPKKLALAAAFVALAAATGCTDNQGINAATGALGGAALGSAVGNGSGKTAAMLTGAAIGGVVGANAPTN
jgi:uncharacterized protein YcfJ